MNRTLLEETIHVLKMYGKTLDDIIAICTNDCQITKENFLQCADVSYDSGYGLPYIDIDLKLIGKDFWLERAEYDGSEWWEYKTMPDYKNLPVKHVDSIVYEYRGY